MAPRRGARCGVGARPPARAFRPRRPERGTPMRVAILDDIHRAYESSEGVRRLRERAEVRIFDGPFGLPSALRGFDALIANRERTRFTRALLEHLPDLRIIAQTGNHAYHIDLAAAAEQGVTVAKAS